MKKLTLSLAARVSVLAGAAALVSCDKPAAGLDPLTVSAEKTVYDDMATTGTSGAAAPAAKPAESSAKPVEPKPENVVAKNDPPKPPAPMPPPVPVPAPPAPAPVETPAAAPATAPAVTAGGPQITIKPDMPKALFAGTPLPDSNPPPNLDKSGKPKLEASAPEGTVLLSKGKPVTSSDTAPLGDLSLITDGDKNGDDGYYVDMIPMKQWVQIDLEASKEINLIWVWHFHKQAVIYKDVVVQVSDDPEFKTGVTNVFNNDFDNSSEFGVGNDQSWVETNNGRSMPVGGVKGRYVRLYSNGRNIDDTNQYIEVEVYGK